MTEQSSYERHFAEERNILASAVALFAYLDDHRRMSVHMSRRSVMMAGSRMSLTTDDGKGQRVGSHIVLLGSFLGIRLDVDEVVIRHDPPMAKEWETVGHPRLIVIGPYRMGFTIRGADGESVLRVSIDYMLPERARWIGTLFGGFYARWCVRQMLKDAQRNFASVLANTAPRRA